jgi:tRNA-dihydrouridine synthase A
MMERTDRHCRYLLRRAAPHAWLYTEMITAPALLRGDHERLLRFHSEEHPLALQLGGSDPGELAAAATLGESAGYDEINLNVGCPSGRVQAGCFGAALMLDAPRVAASVRAMRAAVSVPITVKTRLGVDEHDSYEFLHEFTSQIAAAGCPTLIVHARKAWLKGLSPKQNRNVPPLDYTRVYRLKADFPELEIVINGGLTAPALALQQLPHVDGIMLGRSAYSAPMLMAELDRSIFAADKDIGANDILAAYLDYMERELAAGTPLKSMTRHLMGLFAGRPGGRSWRRELGLLESGDGGLARLRELLVHWQAPTAPASRARRAAVNI